PIPQSQRDQNHADLTDPDIKRTAEILRQKPRADDLQHHDREPAEEDQRSCRHVSHGKIATATNSLCVPFMAARYAKLLAVHDSWPRPFDAAEVPREFCEVRRVGIWADGFALSVEVEAARVGGRKFG